MEDKIMGDFTTVLMYATTVAGFVFPLALIGAIKNDSFAGTVLSSISMGIIVLTLTLLHS